MTQRMEQLKRLAAVAGALVLAAAEALAQEKRNQGGRRIVVSIPDRKLALLEAGRVVRVFPTAVGAPHSPSPTGSFKIVQRIPDPTWYTKGRIVPPGKGNPLGTRWLGLSAKGYGIHGTNNPGSIGKDASHGCIRMRNADVEALFELVEAGDEVEIAGERTPETVELFAAAVPGTVAMVTR